ncbi:amidase [Lutibacter sp. HS1-25]|uniref:amidase n=1 Tax=Lutibacter sp. HS1-25 TaxID=2485000 RepID=UPI0010103D80|nr:amidase [Lutibacter sp. HS1-25]RXP54519.1 amidase [Lutibacter sp. HS1-25]
MRLTFLFILLTFLINQAMGQNTILFKTAGSLTQQIREGKISSYQVVSAYIEQIEKQNDTYNAIVLLNKKQAFERAKEADLALTKGEIWGKLHGVPITIKDNYKTKGLTTTAGYLPLKNSVPDENSELVKLLLAEGAIIIGKTNLSVLAMDMQVDNPIFGKTNNPWDTTRTSGGSSGGCATALATGMTPLSFGNDLAGSIRLPSAYCGVYGFKPTFGVVSLNGIQTDPKQKTNGLKSLAVAGPLARNINDLELALQIIAQTTTTDQRLVPLNQCTDTFDIKKLKIAWTDEFGGVPVDNEIKTTIKNYVKKLEKAGATVVKTVPELDFYQVWKTWGSFVGMQGGYNTSNFVKWLGLPFAKGVLKNVPMHQNIVKPTSVEKYMIAMNIQDIMITIMENFLNEYDVFICPVSSVKAFKHHAPSKSYGNFSIYNNPLLVNNKEIHYYMATQAYTTPFTLTESPVLSMPIALSKDSLPIGIQVIGKRYEDFKLLEIGKILNEYSEKLNFPLQD